MQNFPLIRENLDKDFLSKPSSPVNTLTRDLLLAMVNYAEKTLTPLPTGDEFITGIDHLSKATIVMLLNYTFRIHNINTSTEGRLAIQALELIRTSLMDELYVQALNVAKQDLKAKAPTPNSH